MTAGLAKNEVTAADLAAAETAGRGVGLPGNLAGLAFFDVFNRPLTLIEQWRWQYGGTTRPLTLRECLLSESDRVESEHGLWSVTAPGADRPSPAVKSGRAERWRRYRLTERKFRRARRFAWWARWLPTVRLVAIGNSLAWSNAADDSDIDLFVVTAPETLWLTRLLLGGPLKLFGLRPTPRDQRDKLCLSFMVSESALDLSSLRISNDDIYMTYWLAALMPVYDAGGVMARLWSVNDRLRQQLPAAWSRRVAARRTVAPSWITGARLARTLIAVARWGERPSRWLQEWLFPVPIRKLANLDSRVVITADVLKFHVDDRREQFRQQFEWRAYELGQQADESSRL